MQIYTAKINGWWTTISARSVRAAQESARQLSRLSNKQLNDSAVTHELERTVADNVPHIKLKSW